MGFDWIIPGRLAAGSLPGRAILRELARQDVRVVVSLSERVPDTRTLTELGLRHHHFPLPDMSAPDTGFIERFVGTLEHEMDQGNSVFVHCGAGLGRTGTMLACYLVNEGMSAREAIATVRRARPGSVESVEQEQAVERYAGHLSRKRRHD